jgi:hypothetical protein
MSPCSSRKARPATLMTGRTPNIPEDALVAKNCSRSEVVLIATTLSTAAIRAARSGPMSTLVPCGQL